MNASPLVPADPSTGPLEDFRVRTARVRRAATNRRLCEAAFTEIARQGADRLTVELVCQGADMSRGAFYRHFPTVEALLDYLGAAVGAALNAEMSLRFDDLDDPVLRIGQHLRYQVIRVNSDPACAAVVSRLVSRDGAVSPYAYDHAAQDFADAATAGRFHPPSAAIAVDLAHGMLAAILRTALRDGLDRKRLDAQAEFLLRGCGADPEDARRAAGHPLPDPPATGLRAATLALCATD